MTEWRRSQRILRIFTVMPLIIIAAFYGRAWVPDRWSNLYILAAAAIILGFVVGVPVREHLRAERRSGLVPRRPGFSGKLQAAAQKLREHADLIDEEGDEAGGNPLLESYITELRRVAKAQDNHDLAPGLRHFDRDAARLRKAAAELDEYANRVRRKGGIFQLDLTQRISGVAIVIGMFAWGMWLMVTTWSRPSWTFFGGAFLVAFAVLIGVGLLKSQQDADATQR